MVVSREPLLYANAQGAEAEPGNRVLKRILEYL